MVHGIKSGDPISDRVTCSGGVLGPKKGESSATAVYKGTLISTRITPNPHSPTFLYLHSFLKRLLPVRGWLSLSSSPTVFTPSSTLLLNAIHSDRVYAFRGRLQESLCPFWYKGSKLYVAWADDNASLSRKTEKNHHNVRLGCVLFGKFCRFRLSVPIPTMWSEK